MSRKIDDNQWDEFLRSDDELPEVPRERMWQAIDEARRDQRSVVELPRRNRDRVWRMAAGIAAILVLGVGIGRMSVAPEVPVAMVESMVEDPVEVAPVTSTINPAAEKEVYRFAAANLFGRADYLLTDFKVRSCANEDLGEVPNWAGGMLVQTRLLMDTSAAEDANMKQLLEELELVLAQIVGLSRDNCARDMAWIKQGLQERSTLGRLRMMTDDMSGDKFSNGNQSAL